MKKNCFYSLLLIAVLSSCITVSGSVDSRAKDVMVKWVRSWDEEDIDLLMETYWPEITFISTDPQNNKSVIDDWEILKESQNSFMNSPVNFSVDMDQAEYKSTGSTVKCTLYLELPEIDGNSGIIMINTFDLEKRGDNWGIIKQDVRVKQ